jgi:molybdate transport system ATP-binding protein
VEDFSLDIELKAPPGVTILFGASGAGKSLTLECIAGIITPDSGRIAINGSCLFDSDRKINVPIRSRRVGYVFQNLALFPHLTVRENVEFGMRRVSRTERVERASEIMTALRIEHTADRRPRHISGGEAQRAALARALVCHPKILLLDEPLSALDQATKHSVMADLKALNRQIGLPIVYVTHSREEAVTLGENVVVYERGKVVASGQPLQVFGSPVLTSVARLVGVENVFEGRIIAKSESAGTMTAQLADPEGTSRIEIPFGNLEVGAPVRVAVSSDDILVAIVEPKSTSARNILRGTVKSIDEKANRTQITVESGVKWQASVTRQAVAELGLVVAKPVWLAIKTHSCYMLDL